MQFYATPQNHGLGWLPDLPDQRDKIYHPQPHVLRIVEREEVSKIDLREHCPPVYDQGQLGSCTAQALAAAFDFDRHRQGKEFMAPSRLFIYWNERDLENTVDYDAGARIRDGIKVLCRWGAAPESDWPYIIEKFREKPTPHCYEDAEKNQTLDYQRILTPHATPLHDALACLNEGFPFITGISVYESFESDAATHSGIIPMPQQEEQLLGGHAIVIVGYDLENKYFIMRNSWSDKWGDKGYGYLPMQYLAEKGLADDMWMIRTVET